MPLFYEHNNDFVKIAIWHIGEEKNFFLNKVPLQREITHQHKQLQHLAGRYLLQHLYPDFPHELIEIADTRKPFLFNEEYHFSISHCGDFAAAIVSKTHRVGIDIELLMPKVEKIKHKFLNNEELKLVAGCRLPVASDFLKELTLLWSCKEAVFKWYGKGEVDFKEHIHLQPIDINSEGTIKCTFLKEEKNVVDIQYKFFKNFCLGWIATKE